MAVALSNDSCPDEGQAKRLNGLTPMNTRSCEAHLTLLNSLALERINGRDPALLANSCLDPVALGLFSRPAIATARPALNQWPCHNHGSQPAFGAGYCHKAGPNCLGRQK